ncbi:MAG: hypothetical protein HOL90_06825 [Candidatus Nitrosopelagicus sp.]|jgi:hypothetical protein|nr:hypothetical protein [Candidatus Nitrosopelagicus sp.]
MADDKGESKVRKIIGDSKFTYKNNRYKIIQNAKPSPETKTDFYILAEKLDDKTTREFKISYKKSTYSFIENKIQPHRIKIIYGDNWSDILQNQIFQKNTVEENKYWKKKKPQESLEDSFNNFPLINFDTKKIMLGWRYEIEQLDAPKIGKRTHSGKIEEDITPQIFWGENCRDNMRDALVNEEIVLGSGIPEFILIMDPKDVKNADTVFDNIIDIKDYANDHQEMRAGFISQYYRWSNSDKKWKTEGYSRAFATWIKWEVVDGKIRGSPVLDEPLNKTAGQVLEDLRKCFDEVGITNEPDIDLATLRNHLTSDTISKG